MADVGAKSGKLLTSDAGAAEQIPVILSPTGPIVTNALIYHITPVENLASIARDGILCDLIAVATDVASVNIGYDHIKERRRQRLVTVGPRGTLDHYVPFYFAPRSPMLYTISKGNVEDSGTQSHIVHLVVNVDHVVDQGLSYVFTDGHAEMAVSGQYTDLADLTKIDWDLMKFVMWNDTNAYPNRKQKRQAEFLVHHHCPWDLVTSIGVMDTEALQMVQDVLRGIAPLPSIAVHRDWYY